MLVGETLVQISSETYYRKISESLYAYRKVLDQPVSLAAARPLARQSQVLPVVIAGTVVRHKEPCYHKGLAEPALLAGQQLFNVQSLSDRRIRNLSAHGLL